MYWRPSSWEYRGRFKFPCVVLIATVWAIDTREPLPIALIPVAYLYYVCCNYWDRHSWKKNPYRYLTGKEIVRLSAKEHNLHRSRMAEREGNLSDAAYYRNKTYDKVSR